MAAGLFTITELPFGGEGERFAWTADRVAPTLAGGARAAPKQPWALGGRLRTIRTDYPGALVPSEQVLGPAHAPFTLEGRWSDRWNFRGFAVQEMRRFESVCRRGNRVRIQFQGEVFEGLITDWRFDYRRDWDIGYQFTVSNHGRSEEAERSRSPANVPNPAQLVTEVVIERKALEAAHLEAPAGAVAGTLQRDVEGGIAETIAASNEADRILDLRELSPEEKPSDPLFRLATQVREVGARAQGVVEELAAARADVDLTYRTAMTVLDFESWSRSVRFFGRLVVGSSLVAAAQLEERAEPRGERLYRPRAGESLYAISRRFYGTPYAWRLIADRNALTSLTLTGEEVLVIPERGAAA